MAYQLPSTPSPPNPNPYTYDVSYQGYVYAFYGAGGFTMDQSFDTILLNPQTAIPRYDVTQALQVRFDVRSFNQKLNLYKDNSNQYILDSSFNSYTDRFPNDSITLTAQEFVAGMTASQVISVGTYTTMYTDFIQYVNTYFGYAGGFSSLFASASEFDINHGVFDENSLINLLNTYSTISGEQVYPVIGSITISNINRLLRYAVDTNVFTNRNPATSNVYVADSNFDVDPTIIDGSGTASDLCGNVTTPLQPVYQSNYGMADGFIAGDLIYIPAGSTVKLGVDINYEAFAPTNNVGPTNVLNLIRNQDFQAKYNSSFYSETSSASTNYIQRTLTAPLLIKLDNLSTTTTAVYPNLFIDETGLPVNQYMSGPYRHYTGINGTTIINDETQSPDIVGTAVPFTPTPTNNLNPIG